MTDFEQTKKYLEQKLIELTERAEDIDDDLTAPANHDWQEAAAEAAGDEVLEEVGDVTMEEVAQIKKALALIASGGYGSCVDCGEKIPKGRLEALPYSTKCVKCASINVN